MRQTLYKRAPVALGVEIDGEGSAGWRDGGVPAQLRRALDDRPCCRARVLDNLASGNRHEEHIGAGTSGQLSRDSLDGDVRVRRRCRGELGERAGSGNLRAELEQ